MPILTKSFIKCIFKIPLYFPGLITLGNKILLMVEAG
jgi:hypothetical protein